MRHLGPVLLPLVLACSSGGGGGSDVIADSAADAAPETVADAPADAPAEAAAPAWGTCPADPLATKETLAGKAAYYDAIASRLHIHPQLKWIAHVRLKEGAAEKDATWEDVESWHTGENDGLWSGLYLASQAFRFAVTKSPESLANIKTLLEGEVARMGVTGVPGVFTRQYIPPAVPGIACPADKAHYVPDVEKDDNRWVQVREDGCVWTVDGATQEWRKSDHCGLDAYKGYCWLDNVSQDEYAGHMLALGAIWKLVDDPGVKATAADLLEQVGVHLMENDLSFVDWDGRVTEHGKMWATSFADTPGFLAVEAMDYLRMAAEASGRADLLAFYRDCLLQLGGEKKCLPQEDPKPYTDWLDHMLLYVGANGCKSNYNNFSMVMANIHTLIWYETDPAIRERVQQALDVGLMRPREANAVARRLIDQGNAWFNFIWASQKRVTAEDGPAYEAVEEGICALRQFPASKHQNAQDSMAKYAHWCDGRLDGTSETEFPIPVAEQCVATFLWWGDPYRRETCTEDPREVRQPCDYLLAYWMGRYYGFISEDL